LSELLQRIETMGSDPLESALRLLWALLLTLVTAWVYRLTHRGLGYSASFNVTMVSIAMVVTMTMMVISNYIALSLGLVGALSVIRFRTAIKDPRDIAFLFLSIAIGLACSTGDYVLALVGAALINATLFVLHLVHFGNPTGGEHCLTLLLDSAETDPAQVLVVVQQEFGRAAFRSYSQVSEGLGEYVYSLRLEPGSPEKVVGFLRERFPRLRSLSLISPDISLET
jgi:hypothetical protein